MRRVPLILRQVKCHPPYHPPQGMAFFQPRARPLRVSGDFHADQFVQAAPELGQHLRVQILAAAHGRGRFRQR